MQADTEKYDAFNLCTDMLAAPGVVRGFDPAVAEPIAEGVRQAGKLLLTGEGSSRLFPAKHAIKLARQRGYGLQLHTEAGCQSQGYDLIDWAVLAASNSGRTAEVVQLFKQLEAAGHDKRFSVAAFANSVLQQSANHGVVLGCGEEGAVAATKSVVEQALFYDALVAHLGVHAGGSLGAAASRTGMRDLADAFDAVLSLSIDPRLVAALASASTIYFAGYNDGVAEELTLKTNEITRKKSDYLEGTYAVHGIEEVMDPSDVVVVVDPMTEEVDKFREVLVEGVGLTVMAIADRDTPFPTIRIPRVEYGAAYLQLAAGWNLLVEIGLHLGINLDKPARARKVGNEVAG